MQAPAPPTFVKLAEAMAERRFTLREVVDGLEGSDFEESDDDFDGYLDMDVINEDRSVEEESQSDETESVRCMDECVGAYVEIGVDGSDSESTEGVNTIPEYTLQAGCSVSLEQERPLDFFSLLTTDDMLQHIVTQTNLSARQFIESHELAPHSRVRHWSKGVHDINELRRFLAIIIIMGLVRYPQIEHHWATQWPYSNPHFSSVSYL